MDEKELEEIISKLYALQDIKQNFIKDNNITNLTIVDIVYLGKVQEEIPETKHIIEHEIYMSIEEQDNNILYKYYDENQNFLGMEIESKFIPAEKNMNQTQMNKDISSLDKEGFSLNEYEESKKIEKTEEKNNDNPETIEIPLDQLVFSDLSNTKEQVNLNEYNNGKMLRDIMGLSAEYECIVLVPPEQVNQFLPDNQKITGRDAFVAKKPNGEITVLTEEILQYDDRTGKAPIDENETINADGRITREQVNSRYKIKNGNDNQYLSVGYDEVYGNEIKFSEWSNEKGEYLDTELKTNRISRQDMNKENITDNKTSKGVYNASDKLNSIENIKDSDDNGEPDIEEVDYDKINDDAEIEQAVDEIMENEAVNQGYTRETVKEYLVRIYRSNKDFSVDDAKNYVENDLETSMRGRTRDRNNH